MSEPSRGALACPFDTIRRSFAQAEGLPFAELLSDEQLAQVVGVFAVGHVGDVFVANARSRSLVPAGGRAVVHR